MRRCKVPAVPPRRVRACGRATDRPSGLPATAAFALLILLVGLRGLSARETFSTIAVFPVENLSGGAIPGDKVRQYLMAGLESAGVHVLATEALEEFMTRHRVRYAAGIDTATAEALKNETGADAVVFASVELSDDAVPPRVAMTARLVSVEGAPTVVWAADAGMAGDDAPGFFELGLVNDYGTLESRALNHVAQSLLAYLTTGEPGPTPMRASKFRPKSTYRSRSLEPGKRYSVAVLPFFNLSDRRNAGEILAGLFTRHLSAFREYRVIDAGVTRQELLNARVIMDGGISISDADTVASLVEADLVLAGRVLSYQDAPGAGGRTHVEFSTVLIEKTGRRVVFSSHGDNRGNDGVRFFERGTARTAHLMATQMVRRTVEVIAGEGR